MNKTNISPDIIELFLKNYKNSKVLITGGTKFLGSRLRPALERAGCDLTIIGSKECDLRDKAAALDLFSKGFEIVIHAASVQGGLGYILSSQTEKFLDNMNIHSNVINACQKYPPKRLIGIGSSCSYPGDKSDMKEDDFWNGKLNESVFTYGITKKMLYVGQYSLYKEFNINGAHLVLNNMYGPNDNFDSEHAHVVADLIRKFHEAKSQGKPVEIWGDGGAEREFLYVDDAVEGILRAVLFVEGFELINISNKAPVKIKKLVSLLSDVIGYKNIKYDTSKPTGAKRKGLDTDKCKKLLDWLPATNFQEGLEKACKYYLDNNS